ncbi:Fe(3+)-pyochelin receptor precursor [compost metagenome]
MTSRLKLADPLTLILGGRLDWYEYDSVYRTATSATPSAYKVTRNVTKYAGLIYDLNEHYSVYASYTDIFKPQNYRDADGSLLEPVVGKNYEVGIKGAWFDDQLNASAAIFQMDQENRAKTTDCPVGTAAGLTCYEAAGKVRSKGIDLEVQGALTPLWQVGAGYSYTENTYVKDSNAGNIGKKFDTDLPNQLFKLTTSYTLPIDGQRWRAGGTVYHQSKIYNKGQTYNISQDAYEVVDLMVAYRYDAHIQAQLNFNNVFDKRYYQSITDSPIRAENVYGDPRNFMMSLRYSF